MDILLVGIGAYLFGNIINNSTSNPKYDKLYAICLIEQHKSNSGVYGIVNFEYINNITRIYGKIQGLKPGLHGFHIHESGNLEEGCTSLRGHFNPFNMQHGARTTPEGKTNINRHLGDLGNLLADQNGVAVFDFTDELIQLQGPHSIIGRSIIVHADEDDLGQGGHDDSKKTGHAGHRVGCGVIGWK